MSKIRTPRLARLIAAMFCAGASLPALPADSHGHDAKPAAAKGKYLRSITVSSTMGPGVKIDESGVEASAKK